MHLSVLEAGLAVVFQLSSLYLDCGDARCLKGINKVCCSFSSMEYVVLFQYCCSASPSNIFVKDLCGAPGFSCAAVKAKRLGLFVPALLQF